MVIVYKKKKYRAREQDATTVLKSKNCRTNVQPLQYTATHNYIYISIFSTLPYFSFQGLG
jgi:hypothetical protein